MMVVFSDLGLVRRIVTDRGSSLVSRAMQSLCKRLGIQQIQVAAFHCSANSKIERVHRTVQDILRIQLSNGELFRLAR